MATAQLQGHLGPLPLPLEGGVGTVSADDRAEIFRETGCSVCVRERKQWGGRRLTISGPPGQLERAHALAIQAVLRNGATGGRRDPREPMQREAPPLSERAWQAGQSWYQPAEVCVVAGIPM